MATERVFSEVWHSKRKDHVLINNRQAGRRNRGRNNNGRPNGNNRGGGDNGNRIDNRARGNAAQLLEKYRNMARDAQMAGDRVNAEYYLQFADHYFRVLADNRARQEEQQQRFRPRDEQYDEEADDFDGQDDAGDDFRFDAYDRQPREQARDQNRDGNREQGRDQNRDQNREQARDHQPRDQDRRGDDQRDGNRNRRDRNRRDRFGPQDGVPAMEVGLEGPVGTPADALSVPPAPSAAPEAATEAEAPRRRGRPRKTPAPEQASTGAEAFDVALLPPSIARADNDGEAAAEDAPRKRTRRPRAAAAAE